MTASGQARADAMADAETLRINWEHDSRPLVTAADMGAFARHYAIEALLTMDDAMSRAGNCAARAASAAFRAVPGLRGEDTSGKGGK